jgi:hypothetical protein
MSEWESHKQGYRPDPSTVLVYPIASVNGYKIPVQRLFFGIKRKEYNISDPAMTEPAMRFTNMESVSVIFLFDSGEFQPSTCRSSCYCSAARLTVTWLIVV